VVDHPVKWEHSGYHEIQQPPKRYAVIDLHRLVALCGFSKLADFQQALAFERKSRYGLFHWRKVLLFDTFRRQIRQSFSRRDGNR
jgi:hypothetical protein